MTTTRTFRFRLQSHHPGPERTSTDLAVQWLNGEDRWEPQELSLTMPGFRMYLISLLLCQHFYLVANARERRIPLARVEADFTVTTGADWMLTQVIGDFRLQVEDPAAGEGPSALKEEDLTYIKGRMRACPVSRNLPAGVEKVTSLSVVEPEEG